MIIDKLLQVSNKQAVTATAESTDAIDSGNAYTDVGFDSHLFMVFTIDVAFTAAGAGTLQCAIMDSADGSTFTNVVQSAAIAKTALVKGAIVAVLALPPGLRRYVKAGYTVATGPMTAGQISAEIVYDYPKHIAYPDAVA
jgi:hypothetical protein